MGEGRAIVRALSCAAALLACLLTAIPARAESAPILPSQAKAYEAMAELERVRLLIALCNSGQHELAARLIEAYPMDGEFGANRTLFIEGLILKGRKDYKGAVAKYRKALADDPKLTLVRAELAKALLVLKEDDSAKHNLELLMAAAPNEEEAKGLKSFIDSIDARRPYRFSSFVSIAPSTNINSGSSNDKVYVLGNEMTLDDASKEKSGVGFASGVSAAYIKPLASRLTAIVAGGATGRFYDERDFDSLTLSESIELRYLFDKGYFGIGPVASQGFGQKPGTSSVMEKKLSSYSVGPRVGFSYYVTPKDQVNAAAVLEWRTFPDGEIYDGLASYNSLSWTHAFDPSFAITLGGGLDRVGAKEDYLSYWTASANAEIYKELPNGFTASLRGEVRISDFDGPNALLGSTREDTRLIGTVRVTKRDFNVWGYAPLFEYSYVWNESNQAPYDFDAHMVDFSLTKDF
jgi:tetratricopeptide (TPR) repeat protein